MVLKDRKEFMLNILAVALGGAIGSVIRYFISSHESSFVIPITTLLANILGGLLIGFIISLIESGIISSKPHTMFWKTGLCGGLTTFSTFSEQSLTLLENNKFVHAGIYMSLSLVIVTFCVFVGRSIGRMIFS